MQIVVLEPLGIPSDRFRSLVSSLEMQGHEVVQASLDEEEWRHPGRTFPKAEVVLLANHPFTEEAILSFPKLRFISIAFTGYDHVHLSSCEKRGIAVSNASGYATSSVAELVFGMAISLLRHLPECDRRVRQGGTREGLLGNDLSEKVFGVVGVGAIGSRVAQIASCFGCRVLGFSRSKPENAQREDVAFVSIETLLKESDIVSLHLPLNDETRGFLDRRRLSLMKKGALLINTARGGLVDSEALAEALREGRLAGAGIDVFEGEPPLPPDHPLLSVPNVLLSPHVGFATSEALDRRAAIAFENVRAWLSGEKKNRVL